MRHYLFRLHLLIILNLNNLRQVKNVKFSKINNFFFQEIRIQALVESEERQKLIAERIIMNEVKLNLIKNKNKIEN